VGLEEVDGEAQAMTSQKDQRRCVITKAVMPMGTLHMKISPVKPSRQLGLAPPEGTRGRGEGQRRGTTLK
jgi:hypothetical protein